jgi:phosphosulfolactate synthase (CoM biosynthesis protein A)
MSTLVIGDSIVKYVSAQLDDTSVKCFPGGTTDRINSYLSKDLVLGFDFIIMHVGINDIGRSKPDHLVQSYERLLCNLRSLNTRYLIYCSS